MTIKLKTAAPPPGEAKASIVRIDLPSELEAGKWITGYIYVQNVGTASGVIRLLITTLWDGRQFTGQGAADVNQTLAFYIPEGVIQMPNQDATMRFDAQHQRPDGSFVTDDTKTH
jgi:TM2 domain-containing membrane protein YozV